MLQHTSSEVIIQLQINLNSKIELYGLGTNEIGSYFSLFICEMILCDIF